jgi:ATP-dependent helicase/nuclease subunit A
MSHHTSEGLKPYTDPAAILQRWQQSLDRTRRRLCDRLRNDIRLARKIERLEEIPCSDPSDKLAVHREQVLSAAREIVSNPESAGPDAFSRATKKPGNCGSKKNWDDVKAVRGAIKDVSADIEPYAVLTEDLDEIDVRSAGVLATVARTAVDGERFLAGEKRRRGILTFDDLLIRVRGLAEEHPQIARAIGEGIDQLLIDECQDTNAYQLATLLRLLFGADDPADLPELPPGRVFVVGDDKQSIYRFQGADVDIFRDLCAKLGRSRREVLDLSFRTHPAGVAFVNHLFGQLMGSSYQPSQPYRTEVPDQPAVELLMTSPGEDPDTASSAEECSEMQAEAVAGRIHRLVHSDEKSVWDDRKKAYRKAKWGDIAILLSRRKHSGQLERRLQEWQIPYHVLKGTGLFQQQEVFDVLNALRIVDNPMDDVAFAGVLRSSMVGLDDNALMHLSQGLTPPYLPALSDRLDLREPIVGLTDAQQQAVEETAGLLTSLHRRKDAVGIAALMDEVLQFTGYEATLLAQPQGPRMVGSVRKVRQLAAEADADGLSLADFVARVQEMILQDIRYEQAAVSGESANVVRIMTVHAAKGLEFPVVVLPDLNAGHEGHRGALLHRRDWGWTCRQTGSEREEMDPPEARNRNRPLPLSFRLARKLEKDDALAEDTRLLYVAITRHRDKMILVGSDRRSKDGRYKSDSYLAKLDEALGICQALDADRERISYAGGPFEILLRRCQPGDFDTSGPTRPEMPAGIRLLREAGDEEAFALSLIRQAPHGRELPLVGPVPADRAAPELAVTALADFSRCPRLFHWRYELRLPGQWKAPGKQQAGEASRSPQAIDALTLGTFYHLCMERLDPQSPQSAGALGTAVAAELDLLDSPGLEQAIDELENILKALEGTPLLSQLASAQKAYRELDFLLDAGPIRLRGQIDLLLQDADTKWHVVDYKSDRVTPERLAEHAEGYRLQMLAYCLAAGRYLQTPVESARLYFLRNGLEHSFALDERSLEDGHEQIVRLGRSIIEARRTGTCPPAEGYCRFCPYQGRCQRPA